MLLSKLGYVNRALQLVGRSQLYVRVSFYLILIIYIILFLQFVNIVSNTYIDLS